MRWAILIIYSAATVMSCSGQQGTSGSSPDPTDGGVDLPAPITPILPVESGSLQSMVADLIFAQKDSNGFVAPTESERAQLKVAFQDVLAGNLQAAKNGFDPLQVDLIEFHDVGGETLYLARERADQPLRGWGLYVVNPSASRSLVIEAPHPLFDFSTEDEAAQVFLVLDARALLISGSHRCANALEASNCSGPVNQCGATTPRISDSAHSTQQVFQAAHEVLMDSDPLLVAVALHGFSQAVGEPDAYVSDGTKQDEGAQSGILSNDFAAALQTRTGLANAAQSCNDGGPGASSGLCGTLDVQGRYSNQSTNACTLAPAGATNRFLHIEQSMDLRDTAGSLSPVDVIEALKAMF